MPVLFDVRSALTNYSVATERNALALNAERMREGVVIADVHFTGQLQANGVSAIALEANEAAKSLDALGSIIVRMREAGATRGTHIWAIGGGAIQDVAAFVASIYMRGIAWTYLPTTLLGMVDSCIGGKSSINVGSYKNIVGTFHTPSRVLIDPTLTESLSPQQRVAGLAEAAKICYCRGAAVFEEYLSLAPRAMATPDQLEPIIGLSLRAKQWFIEIDEFDRAERLLLNLGHTFGHALEGASGYRLSHGIAVSVGVLCALALSETLLGGKPAGAAPLLERHMRNLLDGLPDLPAILRDIEAPTVLAHLKADKKHEANQYRFVLFDGSGAVHLSRLPKSTESDAAIAFAFHTTRESLS
jgi:3-dehydroquinate synthase